MPQPNFIASHMQLPHMSLTSRHPQSLDQTVVRPSPPPTFSTCIRYVITHSHHLSNSDATTQAQNSSQDNVTTRSRSKKCCGMLYLPCGMATCLSMLKVSYWLEEHNSYIWSHCSQLVSNSRTSSPSRKCTSGVIAQSQTSNHMSTNNQPAVTLQTF